MLCRSLTRPCPERVHPWPWSRDVSPWVQRRRQRSLLWVRAPQAHEAKRDLHSLVGLGDELEQALARVAKRVVQRGCLERRWILLTLAAHVHPVTLCRHTDIHTDRTRARRMRFALRRARIDVAERDFHKWASIGDYAAGKRFRYASDLS